MKYEKEKFTVVGWWHPVIKQPTYDVKYAGELMAAPFPTAESAWAHVELVMNGLYDPEE